MVNDIAYKFRLLYKAEPTIFRSPGRINLIGEHIDYNDGFVLPAAINAELFFAIAPNGLQRSRIYAYDFDEIYEFDLSQIKPGDHSWRSYLLGVLAQFQIGGYAIKNFDLVFGGNIPIGAGLSSSAAVECGLAFALNNIFDLSMEKLALAKMAQKAEHEYAGVMCGIMDQFANLFGRRSEAVRLDCRSLSYEYYNLNLADYRIVLCDTQVKHSLASSEYNSRRKECEEGVAILSQYDKKILSLRDVRPSFLEQHKNELSPTVFKRCRYVVNEIERVKEACTDLRQNDLLAFGKKLYDTHAGLRHDYEVSCPELDFLVDQTQETEAVIGARMMGGGFGGCTINLVKSDAVDDFKSDISRRYRKHFNMELKTYDVEIVDGTGLAERH